MFNHYYMNRLPATRSTTSCPYDQIYYIQPGDTSYRLAQRYGIPVYGILQANPDVNPNYLRVGQKICIPLPQCKNGIAYLIKPYDTLYKIGQIYNVSVEEISEQNPGLSPSNLLLGQKICIPPSMDVDCPMNRSYFVRPGDTMYNLAKRFNVPLQSLIAYNKHIENPDQLIVGAKLCVPSPMMTPDRSEI